MLRSMPGSQNIDWSFDQLEHYPRDNKNSALAKVRLCWCSCPRGTCSLKWSKHYSPYFLKRQQTDQYQPNLINACVLSTRFMSSSKWLCEQCIETWTAKPNEPWSACGRHTQVRLQLHPEDLQAYQCRIPQVLHKKKQIVGPSLANVSTFRSCSCQKTSLCLAHVCRRSELMRSVSEQTSSLTTRGLFTSLSRKRNDRIDPTLAGYWSGNTMRSHSSKHAIP